MDIRLHESAQRIKDLPVTLQRPQALEGIADDGHSKMTATVPGACMAGVEMTLVVDLQRFRMKAGLQSLADQSDAVPVQGSTFRNGLTSVLAYTPAVT